MRILLLTETLPYPLTSGGRIKTYNTLRMLAREHEVHCHAFVRDARQREHAEMVAHVSAAIAVHHMPKSTGREIGWLARSVARRLPFTVVRHWDRSVFARLRAECAAIDYDAIYCDRLSTIEYGTRLELPAVIYDAHNVESTIWRRYAITLGRSPARLLVEREWRSLRRYERRAYATASLVLAVSGTDAREIRALSRDAARVAVVPIAFDVRHAAMTPAAGEPELLFVGGLHWPPNADAIRFCLSEIFPHVRRQVPGARLTVVGRDVQRVPRGLRQMPGVHFAGEVEDLTPHFSRSRALIVPLRSGSGMRVKIIEAFARGLPVVSTSVGCEGIDAVADTHLLTADSVDQFIRQTVRLLQEDELAQAIAAAARQLALDRYDVSAVGPRLLDAVRSVPVRRGSRPGSW